MVLWLPFGSQVATCGDVTQGDEFDSIECSVPTVDDVGVEGSTVSISLYNPDGQVATLVDGFTYLPPAPTLYSITPAEGPLTGGTPISIRGISFTSLPDMLPIIEFTTAVVRPMRLRMWITVPASSSPRWFQRVRAARLDSCQ